MPKDNQEPALQPSPEDVQQPPSICYKLHHVFEMCACSCFYTAWQTETLSESGLCVGGWVDNPNTGVGWGGGGAAVGPTARVCPHPDSRQKPQR